MIEILAGGIQSTIQDVGRFGYYIVGMPRSGPMDWFSFKMGNLLVGNEINEACIEVTVGLKIRAHESMTIAITGADLAPTLNGREVEMWCTLEVGKGDVIAFPSIKSGAWAYICVSGGIDVPLLLGSKSTFIIGRRGDLGFGGYKGRVLRPKDMIKVGVPTKSSRGPAKRRMKKELIPQYVQPCEVRVVMGPYDFMYTEESVKRFLTDPWKVSPMASRLGYRLEGQALQFKPRPDYQLKAAGGDPSTFVTDGVPIGGVQTPSGMPIVFTRDSAPAGGYGKIATVISTDLNKVAQSKPGEVIRFRQVTIEDAYQALAETNALLNVGNLINL